MYSECVRHLLSGAIYCVYHTRLPRLLPSGWQHHTDHDDDDDDDVLLQWPVSTGLCVPHHTYNKHPCSVSVSAQLVYTDACHSGSNGASRQHDVFV